MLVTTREMLNHARDQGYAIGAFDAENAEMVWAIIAAAEEMCSPVIIQTTPGTLRYLSPAYFAGMVEKAASECRIPVALNLDHGNSATLAAQCISLGYTSIMIDGSALPYVENISLSRKVCELASIHGIPVEGELGTICGKEDDADTSAISYTDPSQAADFVERTGVSSLAIAVGTAHGFYKLDPVLNLELISQVRIETGIPLVLHGASGLSDDVIKEAIKRGISKVNFATDLRSAYTDAIRGYLANHPNAHDPKTYGEVARCKAACVIRNKITICGCNGKAQYINPKSFA